MVSSNSKELKPLLFSKSYTSGPNFLETALLKGLGTGFAINSLSISTPLDALPPAASCCTPSSKKSAGLQSLFHPKGPLLVRTSLILKLDCFGNINSASLSYKPGAAPLPRLRTTSIPFFCEAVAICNKPPLTSPKLLPPLSVAEVERYDGIVKVLFTSSFGS